MENPVKMDDLGVPLFLETPIYVCEHTETHRESEIWMSSGSFSNASATWMGNVDRCFHGIRFDCMELFKTLTRVYRKKTQNMIFMNFIRLE